MNELDQISRVLGSIEAKQTAANQQLTVLFDKMDSLQTKQTETVISVKAVDSRVCAVEKHLAKDVTPTVEEIKRLKQRGIGVLAIIGIFSAGIGIIFTKALKHFLV